MNNDLIEKIKKLLRLSESSNVNEAAVAAQMAADLMRKHQIEMAEIQFEDSSKKEKVTSFIFEECVGKNKNNAKGSLVYVIADFFGCKMLWYNNSIGFIGTQSDLNATKYLYQAIWNQINELCEHIWNRKGMKTGEHGKTWKNSFRNGCIIAIDERLRERKRQEAEELKASKSNALIVLNEMEREVQMFLSKMNIRSINAPVIKKNHGLQQGYEAGKSVNLGNNSAIDSRKNIGNNLGIGFKKEN